MSKSQLQASRAPYHVPSDEKAVGKLERETVANVLSDISAVLGDVQNSASRLANNLGGCTEPSGSAESKPTENNLLQQLREIRTRVNYAMSDLTRAESEFGWNG